MDFKEFKEYEAGDELRHIDWRVSAKKGSLYIKKFIEEREITVILLCDISNSTLFGSENQLKRELATEFCASIAFSCIKNNDKIGLLLFSDKIETFIEPKKSKVHVIKLLKSLVSSTYKKTNSTTTDLNKPLELINKLYKKRIVVFLLSDFLTNNFEKELKITSAKHDLISVLIKDKREYDLPKVGLIEVMDIETNKKYLIDSNSNKIRDAWKNKVIKQEEDIISLLEKNKIDLIKLNTDE
ncbi:MAG: DUF58 domain-containing protein, partial [Candidatus Sericytochromatia bacterium]